MNKRIDYTFKYNRDLGRHGWLRLTPAYSVKLVEDILGTDTLFPDRSIDSGRILDPFCGTATTGIVAAEHGLDCTLYEINPFLYWFATAKGANYDTQSLDQFVSDVTSKFTSTGFSRYDKIWIPPMKNIERWWSPRTLQILGKIHEFIIDEFGGPSIEINISNLLWVSFARLVMECSGADFGHVSVSFKDSCQDYGEKELVKMLCDILDSICLSAKEPLQGSVNIIYGDSRDITLDYKINYVITSPPYPNRISYIRELRPYMYWLGFLNSGEEAGELDWKAIGGTWGSATSRLSSWECDDGWSMPACLKKSVESIRNTNYKNGKTMSQYVLKFFYDIYLHLKSLSINLDDGCELYYVLGNSSFYGNMVNTETIVCEILNQLGYKSVTSTIIRKRNSKKELFEFLITAQWVESQSLCV